MGRRQEPGSVTHTQRRYIKKTGQAAKPVLYFFGLCRKNLIFSGKSFIRRRRRRSHSYR